LRFYHIMIFWNLIIRGKPHSKGDAPGPSWLMKRKRYGENPPLSLGHSAEEVTLVKFKRTRGNENGFVPALYQ
jgi:hypothetical protein